MLNNSKNKLVSLELLRFIAANLIILFHYVGFREGFIGIDIFFIISGFVITYSSENNYKFFFIRRLIRIAPLYWSLTFLFCIGLLIYPNLFNKSYFDLIFLLKSIFFIPFEHNNIGPGLGHSPYIFLGWTLNYEIFFYFLFQISLFINKNYRGVICILIIILFQIIFSNYGSNNFVIKTFSHPVIYEFCLGIYLYYLYDYFISKKISYLFIIVNILFLFIIFYNYLFYDLLKIIFPFLIVSFFLLLNYFFYNLTYLTILGNITYSVYLTHSYVKIILSKIDFINQDYLLLASYIATMIISLLIYYLFEKKIMFLLNNQLKRI